MSASVPSVPAVTRAGPPGSASSIATVAALAAALWLAPPVAVLLLAALSAWTLQRMLPVAGSRPGRIARVACLACVPLQYGLVLGAPAAAPLVLPLVATLGLPLVAVLAGDLAALGDRLALRFQAVMLAVYAPSFAALPGPHAPLVVLAAVAGSFALDGLRTLMRERSPHRSPRMHAAVALAGSVVATGAGGATLAPLVAQPAAAAALVAAGAALCGALGTLTLDALGRDGHRAVRCGVPVRLEAIAFAAPLLWALGQA